jgi:hypothetical protein
VWNSVADLADAATKREDRCGVRPKLADQQRASLLTLANAWIHDLRLRRIARPKQFQECRALGDGGFGRNNLTYWAACRAGEMVASGLLRTDAAVAIIAEAARRAGLSREEAERAAWSGIRRTGGLPHARLHQTRGSILSIHSLAKLLMGA